MTATFKKQLISFLDLTRLEENDSPENIDALCEKATTPLGHVAAVCVYPAFVKRAAFSLTDSGVRIATVANFPSADYSINETLNIINNAIRSGADEVDVVMPYHDFLKGDVAQVAHYLSQCRQVCDEKIMKVILETGALKEESIIFDAAILAIENGADFLKTSTGKIAVGATLSAAEQMLKAIAAFPKKTVGLKISGRVRDLQAAQSYWALVADAMGEAWITPRTFRIGASSLLDKLLS